MSEYLVTGGAGFVGSHLTDRLIEDGNNVTVLDALTTGKLSNINERANVNIGDIRDKVAVDYLVKRSDAVFHLAAMARIRPSIEAPKAYHETNVNGTLNILEACRKYGKKIIFSSSSSVYGDHLPPSNEETKNAPKNPYALQKLIGEYYIRLYGNLYGMDYSIVRYYNVFGDRQLTEGAYATVLGIFQRQKAEGKPLTIIGDGTQKRDFTYVGDSVDATVKCLEIEAYQEDFNIGRGDNVSIQEIADMISPEQTYLPFVEGEMHETLCDNTKAREVLGWKPTVSVQDWIKSKEGK